MHGAIDTLGHLLAAAVTPAHAQGRAQVGVLAQAAQAASGQQISLLNANQDYAGDAPAADQGLRVWKEEIVFSFTLHLTRNVMQHATQEAALRAT